MFSSELYCISVAPIILIAVPVPRAFWCGHLMVDLFKALTTEKSQTIAPIFKQTLVSYRNAKVLNDIYANYSFVDTRYHVKTRLLEARENQLLYGSLLLSVWVEEVKSMI